MRLRDLVSDNGLLCPWRTAAIHGIVVVTFAIGVQSWRREIGLWDYLGFSLSVVILSGAPLAKSVLDMLAARGAPVPPPPSDKGATP